MDIPHVRNGWRLRAALRERAGNGPLPPNWCLLGNKRDCPDPSPTRWLTGTCESLGLDRAFQLAEHRPHILDMPAVGCKLQILLERLDRSRGHNVLVAPIQCAVAIKRRSLDEICVCPGRICLDRPVAGSDRAFNQPEIVLGGAEAEISEARIG